MKAFIAYRHTGEKEEDLRQLLTVVCDALKSAGVDNYCTFFDEENFKARSNSAREIMDHAFEILENSDVLFVVQTSNEKSEGMLMEVGFARARGIRVVVATKDGVSNSYLPAMGDLNFGWSDHSDLSAKIAELNLA